jgi:molecular chaperone DnaK
VYQTEKLLREQGDKITGDEKDKVEAGLKELKDALGGTDIEAIKRATEMLVTASQGFAQRLYDQASQEQAASGGAGRPEGGAPSDDDVVDAEIVDEGEQSA